MPAKKLSKPGRKPTPPAIKSISVTMALRPDEKADLDNRRGTTPRGRYIASKLKLGGKA